MILDSLRLKIIILIAWIIRLLCTSATQTKDPKENATMLSSAADPHSIKSQEVRISIEKHTKNKHLKHAKLNSTRA